MYQCQNNFEKAVSCYKQSLEIQHKIFGPNSINCATAYNNIGHAFLGNRDVFGRIDYTQAIQYFEKALPIFERIKGN